MLIAQRMCLVKDLSKWKFPKRESNTQANNNVCFCLHTEREKIDINCGNTAVRLVSSGLYENSVTVAFDLLDESESNSFKCPQKSEPKEKNEEVR